LYLCTCVCVYPCVVLLCLYHILILTSTNSQDTGATAVETTRITHKTLPLHSTRTTILILLTTYDLLLPITPGEDVVVQTYSILFTTYYFLVTIYGLVRTTYYLLLTMYYLLQVRK